MFAVIYLWLPRRHLAFSQLFDICRATPSSSSQCVHQFLYHHQAGVFSSRLWVVGVPWHANNPLPSCRGSIWLASLLIALLPFLIQLVHFMMPCCHICICLAPLLVATLQHLHLLGTFVDSFLIATPTILVCLAPVLVRCHTTMVCVCCHSSLITAPPFGIWPVICCLSCHPFLIKPAYSLIPAPPSGCGVV